MGWAVQTDAHRKTAEEIEKQSDRGAAIMGGAFLEDRLVQAIKATIFRNVRVETRMFRPDGPLGSFSSKIDVGFMIGIYGIELHQTLHVIRRIRNEFAHTIAPLDFQSINVGLLIALNPGDPKPILAQFLKKLDEMTDEQFEAWQKEDIPESDYFQKSPLRELGFTQPKSLRDFFIFHVKRSLLWLEIYIQQQQTKERPKAWMA